jgi:hypothetical protein
MEEGMLLVAGSVLYVPAEEDFAVQHKQACPQESAGPNFPLLLTQKRTGCSEGRQKKGWGGEGTQPWQEPAKLVLIA